MEKHGKQTQNACNDDATNDQQQDDETDEELERELAAYECQEAEDLFWALAELEETEGGYE